VYDRQGMIMFAKEKQKLADYVSKCRYRYRTCNKNCDSRLRMKKRREDLDFLRNNLKDSINAKTNYFSLECHRQIHPNGNVIAAPSTEPVITNCYGKAVSLRTARQIKIDVALHRGRPIPNIF